MSLILNIDTATENASVCLSASGAALAVRLNTIQKDHASWLHTAIHEVMQEAGMQMNDIKAVAITAGPGSYTGLRVGMASAKGLCYALNIPLIIENTLYVIASAGITQLKNENAVDDNLLICPMIDARRMEVFTAIYSRELQEVAAPQALELGNDFFMTFSNGGSMIFVGTGIFKAKALLNNPKFLFYDLIYNGLHLSELSYEKYKNKQFANLAYSEPIYIKEFYSTFKNTQIP
jgi:tRNA threonylcarbamoyladenosine biosynthesis protein TsaB